jgi:hypothetical protein
VEAIELLYDEQAVDVLQVFLPFKTIVFGDLARREYSDGICCVTQERRVSQFHKLNSPEEFEDLLQREKIPRVQICKNARVLPPVCIRLTRIKIL